LVVDESGESNADNLPGYQDVLAINRVNIGGWISVTPAHVNSIG